MTIFPWEAYGFPRILLFPLRALLNTWYSFTIYELVHSAWHLFVSFV